LNSLLSSHSVFHIYDHETQTPTETTTQEAMVEENTNDENDKFKQEEAVEVTAPKPTKPRRSMSEMGPQQAKASEGLRKHSLDQVSGSEDAQHQKEAKAPASQKVEGFVETTEDEKMEELMRRIQRHRSVLDEILEQEDARGKEGKILTYAAINTQLIRSDH
jgi:hypothetical protein